MFLSLRALSAGNVRKIQKILKFVTTETNSNAIINFLRQTLPNSPAPGNLIKIHWFSDWKSAELLKLHKEFHSTPELCWEQENGEVMTSSWTPDPMEVHQLEITNGSASGASTAEDWHKSHSQEDVYRRGMQLKAQNERNSR